MPKPTMTGEQCVVVVSLPPRPLWQNVRCHWSKRSNVGHKHRHEAWLRTVQALDSDRPNWVRAEIDFAFYWPDKRRRDPINALGACKWAIDGLVDAGLLIDDDKVTPGKVGMHVDAETPRLQMTIRKG